MAKRSSKKIAKEAQKRRLEERRLDKYKNRTVPVDKSKLNLGNSYATPPDFYKDKEFVCIDCGSNEIWTAEQQKWWYEDAGGYFFSTAIRCRSCRKKEKERKSIARETHLSGIKKKNN